MRTRVLLLAGALVLYGALSCSEDPTRVGRPPVVQGFTPLERALQAFTGDTLEFAVRAFDPDRGRVQHTFMVGDSFVSHDTHWVYVVDDTGTVIVICMVSDGEHESGVRWTLDRLEQINHPPIISTFAPVETNPTMIIGTALEFTINAIDPDGDELSIFFTVDGERVSNEDRFIYTATELGPRVVEVVVSDGELFDNLVWNLTVTPVPDTDPPAEVIITLLEPGVDPGEITVEWTAVGQDSMEGEASNYLVRTSPSPVVTEEDWVRASEQPGVPAAVPAGQTMAMTIEGITPARFTHVTVRAVDDFGNLSPIGQSPGTVSRGMRISGRVRNAVTLDGLPDIMVSLAHFSTSTDGGGGFELVELPPIDGSFALRDELVSEQVGAYFDFTTPYVITHEDFLDMYLLPNVPASSFYGDFYTFYRSMTDLAGIPPSTGQRRWELPINLYVPPYSANGLDYQTTIIDVAAEFDVILDTQIFNIVSSIPEPGVEVKFVPGLFADNYRITDFTPAYYPLKARIEFRTLYKPSSVESFKVVIRHELGHALGLNHSIDPRHLMVGGQAPAVPWFTTDELNVIQAYYHIPRGVDMRNHLVE